MKKSVDRLSLIKSMSQQCIAVRIRLLSRMVTNIYDSALSPFGVKLNQISILVFLHLAGEVGYDALCRRLKMEKSTASRNIERMKKRGWLNIVTGKEERRKFLKITRTGEELLGKVHEVWEDAQEKTLNLLGEEGAEVLCSIANGIWKKDKAR
ncbi:MAG: MarR family winged helix-turn-helix transcriptional regulator [Syntrophales bacterium]|jgi:DNA-binding MarR family transcriptional regulator